MKEKVNLDDSVNITDLTHQMAALGSQLVSQLDFFFLFFVFHQVLEVIFFLQQTFIYICDN